MEKEYIKGKGGMLCLDPSRPAAKATVWYFPTGNRKVGDWAGGIVGSASVNDAYNPGGKYPALCAFSAIDGYLYVVARDVMSEETVAGPNREKGLKTPVEVAKIWNGGAISTPILVGDALVAGGYDQRVHLWSVRYDAGGAGRRRRAAQRQRRRHLLDGDHRGARPVLRGGRVRVDADAVGRARLHRLPRRVVLLPGRR